MTLPPPPQILEPRLAGQSEELAGQFFSRSCYLVFIFNSVLPIATLPSQSHTMITDSRSLVQMHVD